jgi:hypothetical protein
LLIALLLSRFARTKKFPGEKHHPVKIHLNVPLKSCKKEFFYFHFARLATIGASCRVRTNLEQGKIMSAAEICFKPLNRKIQQHSDDDKCERESMLHPFSSCSIFLVGTGGLFTYAARRRRWQHSAHTHTQAACCQLGKVA